MRTAIVSPGCPAAIAKSCMKSACCPLNTGQICIVGIKALDHAVNSTELQFRAEHKSAAGQTLMGEAVVLPGREDRPDAPGRCREGSGLRRRRPLERAGPSSSSSLVPKLA